MALFSQKVLKIVAKIPKGSVLTYKEVAKKAGNPLAFRAVGNILNKNYDPAIPCHRVIRSDGVIGGYNRGAEKKKKLLAEEYNDFLEQYEADKFFDNETDERPREECYGKGKMLSVVECLEIVKNLSIVAMKEKDPEVTPIFFLFHETGIPQEMNLEKFSARGFCGIFSVYHN